jgi:hypothetical protein
MAARAGQNREGRRNARLLPVFFAALIVLPNNPFVASAAAQAMNAAEGAANSSVGGIGAAAGAAPGAAGISAMAPVPLALTPQSFAAPLTAASLIPTPAASISGVQHALAVPSAVPAALAPAAPRPAAPAVVAAAAPDAVAAAALPAEAAAAAAGGPADAGAPRSSPNSGPS